MKKIGIDALYITILMEHVINLICNVKVANNDLINLTISIVMGVHLVTTCFTFGTWENEKKKSDLRMGMFYFFFMIIDWKLIDAYQSLKHNVLRPTVDVLV